MCNLITIRICMTPVTGLEEQGMGGLGIPGLF